MPVSRASAAKLRRDQLPYTTLPNETVLMISNPDALAIWVYLQTRPSGWTVRPTELRQRFNLGRDRSAKAMRDLKALGLITQAQVRGEDGRLRGSVLHVHYEPVQDGAVTHDPKPGETPAGGDDPDPNDASGTALPDALDGTETADDEVADESASVNAPGQDATEEEAPQPQPSLLEMMEQNDPEQRLKEAFEVFYNAGLPKKARKNAEKAFCRVAKKQSDPMLFAEMLVSNIQSRLLSGEIGFTKLHPTTYLNQERWLDEIDENGALTSVHGCPDERLYLLFGEVMAEHNLTHKVPKQDFDIFRGTRGHQEMLARWDRFFGTSNSRGQLRYNDEESGLAFWRYAFKKVAQSQNFQQSDVTISTFFYRDTFHRAVEGTLRQHGAAR